MTCMAEEWAAQRSSAGGGHPMNVLDSAEDVKCTTNEEAFPWIVIDLRRPYRITKVAFLSGDKPIENLEIVNFVSYFANTTITQYYDFKENFFSMRGHDLINIERVINAKERMKLRVNQVQNTEGIFLKDPKISNVICAWSFSK